MTCPRLAMTGTIAIWLKRPGDLGSQPPASPRTSAIALELADATLRFASGGSASCDAATLAAADVSGDDRVTSSGALMILQAAAGQIEL